MLTEEDKIYAAGILDARGSIYIHEITDSGSAVGFRHRLRVEITSKELALPHWMQSHFGGSVSHSKRDNYTWVVCSENAHLFLLDLAPFIKIRKDEFQIAIKFARTYRNDSKKRLESSILTMRRDCMYNLKRAQGHEGFFNKGYGKGYSFNKKLGKFESRLVYENEKYFIGYFDTADEAKQAHDKVLGELSG